MSTRFRIPDNLSAEETAFLYRLAKQFQEEVLFWYGEALDCYWREQPWKSFKGTDARRYPKTAND
jgi:hypothetical protein